MDIELFSWTGIGYNPKSMFMDGEVFRGMSMDRLVFRREEWMELTKISGWEETWKNKPKMNVKSSIRGTLPCPQGLPTIHILSLPPIKM